MKTRITNIREIVTPVGSRVAVGADMDKLSVLTHSDIILSDGNIESVIPRNQEEQGIKHVIDAEGAVILPAFVDPHTHLVFGGTREDEFNLRIRGKKYMEIARMGGGINSTVRATRSESEDTLFEHAVRNLRDMVAHGTATFEIKSGYGLETETELKQLRVIKRLQESEPVDIKATFLGAHEIPPEYQGRKKDYVNLVCEDMLPAVKEQGIAEYCDIFCETGVFDIDDSRKILNRAKELGFKLRIHADELTPLGGGELAGELGAASADHLVHVTKAGIAKMVQAGVVFVMLPGTTFFLMSDKFAPAGKILEAGGILALSTDFNPGSSYTHSMPMVITIACLRMGLTIEQGINAATLNGAYSLGLQNVTGSIHPGKQADLIFLDAPSYKFLVYNFGVNRIRAVMKKGQFIYQKA
ncbi:MAG: imidazolonepropionase [Acidobacteria bacterium]|nr:MAG: imidazolonepropionase [Acidobacteriota bacterium]